MTYESSKMSTMQYFVYNYDTIEYFLPPLNSCGPLCYEGFKNRVIFLKKIVTISQSYFKAITQPSSSTKNKS